jgi:hypothetical protein
MPLLSGLSRTWAHIQCNLFPWLTEELGPLTEAHKRVVMTRELAGIEAFVQVWPGLPGRPPRDRAALARAFVVKAVVGLPTTSMLIERLTGKDSRCRTKSETLQPRLITVQSSSSKALLWASREVVTFSFPMGSHLAIALLESHILD